MKIINGYGIKILFAASIMTVAFCGYLFYCIVLESWITTPIVYWEGSFASDSPLYYPDDTIRLRVVATKNLSKPGQVSWALVNQKTSEVVFFNARSTLTETHGKIDAFVPVGTVPSRISSGYYFMQGVVSFDVNPFKTISLPTRSNVFEIREGAHEH